MNTIKAVIFFYKSQIDMLWISIAPFFGPTCLPSEHKGNL